jgi:hypothetical protein
VSVVLRVHVRDSFSFSLEGQLWRLVNRLGDLCDLQVLASVKIDLSDYVVVRLPLLDFVSNSQRLQGNICIVKELLRRLFLEKVIALAIGFDLFFAGRVLKLGNSDVVVFVYDHLIVEIFSEMGILREKNDLPVTCVSLI